MKLCYVDFEFNSINEPFLNLVSVAAVCHEEGYKRFERKFWLYEGRQKKEAQDFFRMVMGKGYIFVAFVMEAEARGLFSLFDSNSALPKTFQCIDLYLEYRCLLNHAHDLAYGPQYLDGKEIVTKPPKGKWEKDDGKDTEAHHDPSYSLASATYKLIGEKIDTKEKDDVRSIIIKGDPQEIKLNRERILAYNFSDIFSLPRLLAAVCKIFITKGVTKEDWLKGAFSRGSYAVATAKMIALGYPINHDKVNSLVSHIDEILDDSIADVLQSTPDFTPFRRDKKTGKYVLCTKPIKDWIKAQGKPYWRVTPTKALSLSADAFKDWYSSESEGFAGAYCRHLSTKQSLNGFVTPVGSSKKRFTDFVAKRDGRIRPYFGIYGSQSSRSQPGAVGFIPLKARWMRNLIEAPAGRALAGVDYASQEFLIAAILSQDKKMMEAYASGDVYIAFARSAGLVPPEATKESHKKMRDLCKAIVLGISYDMSARGLAPRLTQIGGVEVSEEKAEEYIAAFNEVYEDYYEWKQQTVSNYYDDYRISLPDGWTMWGDNKNKRSVGNFPVQGHGAVIMREAVRLSHQKGLSVIYTLHDALYIEYESFKTSAIATLMLCMAVAFENVMKPYGDTVPIMLEGESWSVDYKDKIPAPIKGIDYMAEYIDERGKKDLDKYRKYFTKN